MRAANLSSLGGKLSRPVAFLTFKFSSNFWNSLVLQLVKEKVWFEGGTQALTGQLFSQSEHLRVCEAERVRTVYVA